ncbi:hypothetical protein Egran_01453 [Elaphomyces granulatus]|uniref:Efflux pump dotC n=1 Tax=Elaphomyces granulatus TaxID=519963 RepID=A0A232M362_9EURO|nr:hypothetical protein Egran_01453 [Elaphomyces granulatus]
MGSIRNDASSESASEQEKFSSPQKKSSLEDSEKSINMEALAPEEKANPVRSEDGAPATEPEGDALDRIPSQAQKLGKKKIIIIMTALCLALFLAALDMTIVSTALPTMAAHFNANQSGYSWMASSYLLANAASIPLWGKISDIWGRKPILLLANFVFLIASLICGVSISLTMIITGRAIQGVGAGGLIVLGNICITDLFSMRERSLYYGLFGATWAIASALGPLIGGAFTTRVTWRWCFYLNLPIGGISFVILLLFLSIETPQTSLLAGLRAIDWIGTVTCIGGTLMFLFGLEFGGVTHPWDSPTVLCLIIFGPIVWVLFILAEWKLAKYPIMPLRLFRDSHNLLLFLVCFCHAFVFIAGAFFLPLYFQTALLATPILSGVYVLPLVLSLSITSAAVGGLIRKTGRYKEVIVLGTFFMTLGFGLLIDLKSYASWSRIIIFQMIAGVGVGPNFQSPLVALQANIHASDMAAATATFSFIRQLSTSTSVVLGTVVYQNIFAKQLPQLISIVGPETASRLANSFSGSDKDLLESLSTDQRAAVLEAFTYSLSRAWIFYTCVAAFGLFASLFLRRIELSRSHQIAKTGLAQQERARLEMLAEKKASSNEPTPEV